MTMAFGLSYNAVKGIYSYEDALKRWTEAKPWRGETGENDARPLGDRKKKHMSIRRLDDGSLACRYHSTDVVIWRPDGAVGLKAWRSSSTDVFANMMLPSGVAAQFNHSLGPCVFTADADHIYAWQGVAYKIDIRRFTQGPDIWLARREDGTWAPTDECPAAKIEKLSLDRKKLNTALKHHKVRDALNYIGGVIKLAPNTYGGLRRPASQSPSWLIDRLAGPEGWDELAHHYKCVDAASDAIRKALTNHAECVQCVELDSVPVSQLTAIRRGEKLYNKLYIKV